MLDIPGNVGQVIDNNKIKISYKTIKNPYVRPLAIPDFWPLSISLKHSSFTYFVVIDKISSLGNRSVELNDLGYFEK